MRENYFISLSGFDLGQLLDGLDAREQAWRETAEYYRTGEMPRPDFICEECTDATEAQRIAEHYERITTTIRNQRKAQQKDGAPQPILCPGPEVQSGFCIFVNTLRDGSVPAERDRDGHLIVYATEIDAQREIADIIIGRIHEFLLGERDFEDAMTLNEFVAPVDLFPDGSAGDEIRGMFS
jgi:hypothetical protein